MELSITSPKYNHIEYNRVIRRSDQDSEALDTCKRVALATLPFITLYKPAGFALTVGTGVLRVFSDLTVTLSSPHLPQNLIKLAVSSASLTATFLAHPLGLLIATGYDLTGHAVSLAQHLYANNYSQALYEGAHVINQALYLGLFIGGGMQLLIASLSMQALLGLYHSQDAFRKGHWIEGCSHLGMTLIRLNQMQKCIVQLEAIAKANSLSKCKGSSQVTGRSCNVSRWALLDNLEDGLEDTEWSDEQKQMSREFLEKIEILREKIHHINNTPYPPDLDISKIMNQEDPNTLIESLNEYPELQGVLKEISELLDRSKTGLDAWENLALIILLFGEAT